MPPIYWCGGYKNYVGFFSTDFSVQTDLVFLDSLQASKLLKRFNDIYITQEI